MLRQFAPLPRVTPPAGGVGRFPLWVIAAAGFGLVGALAAMLVGAGGGGPLDRHSALAVPDRRPLVVFAEEVEQSRNGDRAIVVFDSATGERRRVGSLDTYRARAWSPDGRAVAALASDDRADGAARLHLVSPDAGSEKVVALPGDAAWIVPAWAPDGQRLAIVGSAILLIDAGSAAPVAQSVLPETSKGPVREHSSGGYAWSPDSRRFAAIVDEWLAVCRSDGVDLEAPLEQLIPGADGPNVVVLGWRDPSSVVLGVGTPFGLRAHVIDTSVSPWTDVPLSSDQPYPLPSAALGPGTAALHAVEGGLTGARIGRWEASADGAADVFEIRSTAPGEVSSVRLLIRERDTGASVAVDLGIADTRGGRLTDVVMMNERDQLR